jgi:hypothetical protein
MFYSLHRSQDSREPNPGIPKVELVSQKLKLEAEKSVIGTLDKGERSLTRSALALDPT